MADDCQEAQASLPVFRLLAEIERQEGVGWHAFALHFVHERGEAVGKIDGGGRRRNAGAGLDQPCDQGRKLQAAAKRADRRGQVGAGQERVEFGDKQDAGQEAGLSLGEQRFQPPLHAPGVYQDGDARQRLGRLSGHAGQDFRRQFGGKIGTRRQTEDARLGGRFKHRRASFPRRRDPRGGRCRTSRQRGRRR